MTTYHDLTGFRRDLLLAIATPNSDTHGLGLKQWLDAHYSKPINHSRLYQNLDHLREAGLVTREAVDDRTDAYELTEDGRILLRNHINTLAPIAEALSNPTATAPANGGDR